MTRRIILSLFLMLVQIDVAVAHTSSNSFIYMGEQPDHRQGRLDLAVDDLPILIPWQLGLDNELSWQAFQQQWPKLQHWLNQQLLWHSSGGACSNLWAPPALSQHGDGLYVALSFQLDCPAGRLEKLNYTLLFSENPLHRGLVSMTYPGGETQLHVATHSDHIIRLSAAVESASWQAFPHFSLKVSGI